MIITLAERCDLMDSTRLKLMVDISKLYYLEGLSQSEIAKKMYISRPQVSRILSEAREKNIVSITVKDPFSEAYKLADDIKNKFHLSDVLVVDTYGKEPLRAIAEELSRVVSSKVRPGDYIGISAGKTLAMCSSYTMIHNSEDLKFIPLLAGATSRGIDWYANNNCRRFSERLNAGHMVLSTPMVIREEKIRKELINNPAIKPVFEAYEKLDIIITGIGQTTTESSLSQCDISNEEILTAHQKGAQAIIAGSFIDAEGNEILKEQSDMFLGAKIRHIKKCPCVIAAAEGLGKTEAIRAALKGGIIDIFCTNSETARELLQ